MLSRTALWLLCAALFSPLPGVAQISLTHVANAGFLLTAGETRVLVDALFDEGIAEYGTIPEALRPALEEGRAPFAGVDLVLATHAHRDHFTSGAVIRFLEANPQAVFVSTPQAVAAVADAAGSDSPLLARARAVLPANGQRLRVEVAAPLELWALPLHHGRSSTTQNLGFLVRLAGATVLHVGDSEVSAPEIEPFGLAELGIDLALLPYWLLIDGARGRALRDAIDPVRLAAMHLPSAGAPASSYGPPGSFEALAERIRAIDPRAELIRQPLATMTAGGG